jgi:uncharacterized protein (DUF58 family)
MPYILAVVVVALAVVLGIFTGVWGGLIWLVAAGGALLVAALLMHSRDARVTRSNPEPQDQPRAGPPAPGTANRRVQQS